MTIALCDMMSKTHVLKPTYGMDLMVSWQSTRCTMSNSKDSWLTMHKQIETMFKSYGTVTKQCQCGGKNVLISCIGPNACKGLPINSSSQSLGMSTNVFALSTKTL